jgi:hypothetical protein
VEGKGRDMEGKGDANEKGMLMGRGSERRRHSCVVVLDPHSLSSRISVALSCVVVVACGRHIGVVCR